jgi:UDP-N-acetylenolpyruvoylglucosamine reductase
VGDLVSAPVSDPWTAPTGDPRAAPTGDPRAGPAGDPCTADRCELPAGVERDYPLARLTTIRTGGPAELFARPGSLPELERLLSWAAACGIQVGVVGSGSNLLVADAGVRGLVVKLDGELSKIELDDVWVYCGAGARLPAVAARVAQAGLEGLEFGVNIPGTVGGAVRMNANAYGGELARVLEWVDVATGAGTRRLDPSQLGFGYRRSGLGAGEVVARVGFRLTRSRVDQVKARLADMRARRRAAQPVGVKTFGSTFKNPDDRRAEGRTAGQLLEEAGCRGLRIGGAGFSEKHANFIVNHGQATTADVVAVMAEGRRRVRERFGITLEPEVQTLGPVNTPAGWSAG